MSFIDDLSESASAWSSAYLQFITGRGREEYTAYAFVEDNDDKIFYQHVLSNYDDIGYLGCGGKSGVIEVFKKLREDGLSDGSLFFVDSDTEMRPYQYESDILRTEPYSWEGHACEPSVVRRFLQIRSDPNLSIRRSRAIEQAWRVTVGRFCRLFSCHCALLRTASELGKSLEVHEVNPLSNISNHELELSSDVDNFAWFDEKVELAASLGASIPRIFDLREAYAATDQFLSAQGKLLFRLLRLFIRNASKHLGFTIIGEYNSPRAVIASIPWDHSSFKYIQTYVSHRVR